MKYEKNSDEVASIYYQALSINYPFQLTLVPHFSPNRSPNFTKV